MRDTEGSGVTGVVATVRQRLTKAYGSVPNAARMGAFALLLFLIPYYINPFSGDTLFDSRWLVTFRLVGLYIMLGIGLNIVVGYAGLLDLGYVAFFATGAYLYALLASPASPAIDFPINDVPWLFWALIPAALVTGALVGIILGIPVLPLRGDYLAIVTLGFGEIIRLFLVNERGFTGGSQGLYGIRAPPLPKVAGLTDLTQSAHKEWFYFIVIGAFIAAFLAARLRDSRMGRAWEAIREDEDVAEAMGIDTVKYKLMAFAMGAAIGALGGMIFGAFQGATVPESFNLFVSINVISLIVIGGMGSTPGVIVGAFILIGLPDILRYKETSDFLGYFDSFVPFADTHKWGGELADNRFVVFGLLLVLVVVLRPTGLIPSQRRKLEYAQAKETVVP
ncbi:MAG TPA: branched-chain amino acid ABC transporter permease [Dehalococcoidia bacterium]|nr:branched-chain amino acid ABC transporter permease [Dehalococcoidia bacterium]